MLHPHSSQFHALFEGFRQAYGVYSIKSKTEPSAKGKVKGAAASLIGEVTQELWSKHLNGEQGLGIIPINESNLCRFGAIDVDDYSKDPASLQMKVQQLELPLVVCRTKSGGAHLYCFTTDFVPAALMKERLSSFASILGVGSSEIYPKQSELLVDRGDAGSWINMPYFGGEDTERYAYGFNGIPIKTIEEFLKYAGRQMVDPETLSSFSVDIKEPLGPDAPPCLNCLCAGGFPEGTRNNGLMMLGVFAILRNKDSWERDLDEFNSKFMDPPLGAQEVLGVVKSLKKKEYHYMCKQQPMASYCNRGKCRTIKYGIGPSTGMPAMGTLTKFATSPPIWFVDIESGGRLELTTEDLQQPLRFQKACMEQLDIMPPVLKRDTWSELVANMLERVNIVHVAYEATPEGLFQEYLAEFLNVKHNPKNVSRDVLLLGQIWIHEDHYYFRVKDLIDFLTTKRFLEFKQNKIVSLLRDMKAQHHFFNITGRGINCYALPIKGHKQSAPFSVPTQNGTDII